MTRRTGYRLALLWLSLVALLRAVDLGLRAGHFVPSLREFGDTGAAIAEVLLHMLTIYGLRSRYRWGWGLAAVWIPAWIALMNAGLWSERDVPLALLWVPLFCCSALAHRFLLRDDIREAYGITRQPWRSLRFWLPYLALPGCVFLPLAFAFDPGIAGALILTAAVASATLGRGSDE